ncbi:MAG: hypothetical protein Phog2KO_30830 [Phototrophicaceae bacterium]
MTKRALVIDDNANNVSVMVEMLTLENVEYVAIQNPRQINAVIAENANFDVVFLDLEMPHIDGYEMLKMFQSDARFENVPIVVYTVHVSEIGVARELGFHSFIGKPLDLDKFPIYLESILNDEPVWVTP